MKEVQARQSREAVAPGRPSWTELGLVAVGLVVLGALEVAATDSEFMIHRQFWHDELFTLAIVADPNVGHALEALANGVDTNPPTLHLLLRMWAGLWGSQAEVETVFRSFALLSMFLTLLGTYLVLRDLFSPLPALVGVLLVWCQPEIQWHAVEARFYGPWLAGLVGYAFVLSRALGSPTHWGWRTAVGALAVFVCTIHYFGIFALGLITVFEGWLHRPWGRRHLPLLAAVALAPLALLACTPFFLGQRAVLTVGTWIEPPTLVAILAGLMPVLAIFCLLYLRQLLVRNLPAGRDPSAVLGLLSLALLPPVLMLFTVTVQPATLSRYQVPALLALAPLATFGSMFLPRLGQFALCLGFTWLSAVALQELATSYRVRDRRTEELIAAIRTLPVDTPVAFEFTNSLNVVAHYAPDLAPQCYFLDFERTQIEFASKHRITCRDVARQVLKYQGQPGLLAWTRFQTLPTRFLVPGEWLGDPVGDVAKRFPGFTLHQRQGGLYEAAPVE